MSARSAHDFSKPSTSKGAEFSIRAAILAVCETGRPPVYFQEASDAIGARLGRPAKGFYLPERVLYGNFCEDFSIDPTTQAEINRAAYLSQNRSGLVGSIATAGGYTVPTELQTGSLIELLRNKMVVARMGARVLSGLSGNIAIPKITGGATAYWGGEVEQVAQSQQTFGQLILTPHRLVGDTVFSKELLVQSSLDVEMFVRDDLMATLALAKDLAALAGTGGNQPLGVINTSGLATSVTFGAAATFPKVVEFETNVATANADTDSAKMAYITTAAAKGKLKSKLKDSVAGAGYIWENETVNGYPAYATNQVPGNLLIFGNWKDLIIADWNGIDVVVDPYSLKRTGQIEITISQWTDIGIRHPVSFSISTDSAAQ